MSSIEFLVLITAKYFIFLFALPLLYFWFKGERRLVLRAVFAALLSGILAFLIGFLFPVERPFEIWDTEPAVPVFFFEHNPDLRTASFPSKHTAVGFAIAFSFFVYDATLGGLLLVGALLMGAGRVFAFVHRWIDVGGGIFVGLVSVQLIKLFSSVFREHKIKF